MSTHRTDGTPGNDVVKTSAATDVLIVGIGNDYRSDDSAGLRVVRAIQSIGEPGTRIAEASGEGTVLLDLLKNAHNVIVVDAVTSGNVPGTIMRYDLLKETLPAVFFRTSTHAFGIAEAVGLARTFNSTPDHLLLFGIEGKRFEAGTELSREVGEAIPSVVQAILNDIRQFRTIAER